MKQLLFLLSFVLCLLTLFAQQNVGIGTTTPKALLHVADSSVLFSADNGFPSTPGNPPESGPGMRMMWYADKGAFRSGFVILDKSSNLKITGNFVQC